MQIVETISIIQTSFNIYYN